MSLPIPPESDRDRIAHELSWLAHVRAGWIGAGADLSVAQLLDLMRAEEVMLGRSSTFHLGRPDRPYQSSRHSPTHARLLETPDERLRMCFIN